jgi:hypothetical protein
LNGEAGVTLTSAGALWTIGIFLTLANALLSLDSPRWERRFTRARESMDLRDTLVNQTYKQRPTGPFYDVVPRLALGRSVPHRKQRVAERAQLVSTLDDAERNAVLAAARLWTTTVGDFARQAGELSKLPLRPFLATYHLGVIREASVALPVLLWLWSRSELSAAEKERIEWGVALLNLAVWYNRVARQQREPVFFLARGHTPPVGPVLRPPSPRTTWLRNIADTCSPNMRLRGWRRWQASRWLDDVLARIDGPETATQDKAE